MEQSRGSVDVVVTGRVQGVGFRLHAQRVARAAAVDGWVRNEPDGSVAAHLVGDPDAVERVLAGLREGPPGARVDAVDVRDAEPGEVRRGSGLEVRG